MKTLFLSIGCAAFIFAGCAGQGPRHMMIEQAFFKCNKCRSIEGGIYGKGPFMKLHDEKAAACVHRWQRINKDEFKELAEGWHDVNWGTPVGFWE